MYKTARLLSRILVWLAAAMVPVQPGVAACCCGSKAARQDRGAEKSHLRTSGPSCCCCGGHCCHGMMHGACCGRPAVEADACEGRCACQHDHAPPAPPLAPPTSRSPTVEDLSSPPATVLAPAAEAQTSAGLLLADTPIRFDSAADRCVRLSKLVL